MDILIKTTEHLEAENKTKQTNCFHLVQIAVAAADVSGDVDVDDVSFLERAGVRNAVANHL